MALLNTYPSYMPMGTIDPVSQNIHELSSTQEHMIGAPLVLADGRRFRYSRSAGALAVGKGCAPVSTLVPEPVAINLVAGYAIGDRVLEIDAVALTAAAGLLAGGYITTVAGDTYPIIGNTAVASNACNITLGEPLRAALANNAVVQLAPSLWAGVSQTITTIANKCAGVPLVAATAAGQYLWIQTKGVVGGYVASNTDVAYGDELVLHTDGEFLPRTLDLDATADAATYPMTCAVMAQANVSDTDLYCLIDLCCE